MIRLLPPAVHRTLLRLAHRARRWWWRIARPRLHGVSIAAFDGAGRVLLIRQSYGTGRWCLPGGGLKPGENPMVAAAREFAEELRCVATDLVQAAVLDERLHGTANRVHLFRATCSATPRPDGREVIAARFFALDSLPADRSASVSARLELLP